jgi:hypothetical protein
VAADLLLGALMLGPPIGLLTAIALRCVGPRRTQFIALASSATVILLAIGILTTPWSLAGRIVDFAMVALAYFGYCIIVFLGPLLIPRVWLAVLLLFAGLVPIGVGYSPLGLFVVGVSSNAATSIEVPTAAGVCRATWDWPLGDSLAVELVWRPRVVPFVERRRDWWKIDCSSVPTHEGRLTLATLQSICARRVSFLELPLQESH